MSILKRLVDWWRESQSPRLVPAKVYGRTRKCLVDPSGVYRIDVFDAHRGPGVSLLPKVSDATWMVLVPFGSDIRWVPVEKVNDQPYIDANDPVLLGILIDGVIEAISQDDAITAARALPSGKGIGVGLAFYDLDGAFPKFFIPPKFIDELEEDWGFDMEIRPFGKSKHFPSFEDVIEMMSTRETLPRSQDAQATKDDAG